MIDLALANVVRRELVSSMFDFSNSGRWPIREGPVAIILLGMC